MSNVKRYPSEPVRQLPNGQWVTVAHGMPVTVNVKGKIVTRGVSDKLRETPAAQRLLGISKDLSAKAKTEKNPKRAASLNEAAEHVSNKWWEMMGFRPFKISKFDKPNAKKKAKKHGKNI